MDTPTYDSFHDWLLGKAPEEKLEGPGCPIRQHWVELGFEFSVVGARRWWSNARLSVTPQTMPLWAKKFVKEIDKFGDRWTPVSRRWRNITAAEALAVLERVGR